MFSKRGFIFLAILVFVLSSAISVVATQRSIANWRLGNQSEASYRIKPKDVLQIRIENCECQCFGDTQEVDDQGYIHRIPFIEKPGMRAAGKTTAELTADIVAELNKYIKDPKVKVAVAFRS